MPGNIERRIRSLLVLMVLATTFAIAIKNQALADDDVVSAKLPTLTDEGAQTACGPIACFVAMRFMGVECSLDSIILKCGWEEGELTTLQRMQDTFEEYNTEIVSEPIRVSPQELVNYLESGNYVVVMPIRKKSDQVNHAVCAVGFEDGNIIAIDYPELTQKYSLDKLSDIWDGPILLVSRSYRGWLAQNAKWLILPSLTLLFFAMFKLRDNRITTSQQSGCRPQKIKDLLGLGFVFLTLLQLVGCDDINAPKSQSQELQPLVISYDFGIVSPGELVKHEFKIKNEEQQEIKYSKYNISCPCLSVIGNSGIIPVNAEGKLKLQLDTRGDRGRVTRYVHLSSNDRAVKPVVLELTGIISSIWPSSATIDLGDLKTGLSLSRSFLVFATGYPDAKIESVNAEDPVIKTTVENIIPKPGSLENGMKLLGQVKLKWDGESLPPGPFESTIKITTNVPEYATINVSVDGYARGSLEVSPASLLFGTVSGGSQIRRSCKLINTRINWTEVQSLQLTADHEFINGTFSRDAGAEKEQLILNVDLNVPVIIEKGLIKGDLVVSNKNGELTFSVPYVAYVK